MPAALDGAGQNALVLRAIARDAPRHDLALLRQKAPQAFGVLEIKRRGFFGAKAADFFLKKSGTAGTGRATTPFSFLFSKTAFRFTANGGSSGRHQKLLRLFDLKKGFHLPRALRVSRRKMHF